MVVAVWPLRRRERRLYSRSAARQLDLEMPPPYDVDPQRQASDRQQVESLIGSLAGGLDAGSREVLNNLINDMADQALAELRVARDNRQAINDILEGLARQAVARFKPLYDADLARVQQAGVALTVTFTELTGLDLGEVAVPRLPQAEKPPLESTLGAVDVSDDRTYIDVGEIAARIDETGAVHRVPEPAAVPATEAEQ
jgi:hypothetical protein